MDSKQDYFRSPVPRNFEYFCSPFRLVRHQTDPFLINNSLSPFNRNTNNYIPLLTPHMTPIPTPTQNNHYKPEFLPNKISFVLPFDDDDEDEANIQNNNVVPETPQKNVINVTQLNTTARKKYDLRVSDHPEKQNHLCREGQRGLRALSKQAFEIFQASNSLTYQQVAEKIIDENEDLSEYPEKKKQRQSIKRRVYDALNVLIAVGLLEKTGKKISISRKRKEERDRKSETIIELNSKLESKRRFMEIKRKKLEEVILKKESLNNVIQRNQSKGQRGQKIQFPFVIGFQSEQTTKQRNSSIKLSGLVCGDIDAISKLELGGSNPFS